MRRARGRGAAIVGLAVLLGALTACTDRVPAAAPGTGTTTVSHSSGAPRSGAAQQTPPDPSAPATGRSTAAQSPQPGAGPATPPAPSSASPTPSVPGTDTRTGPFDDGGEDARVFCSPSALSLTFRTGGDVRGGAGSRPGADVRTAGDAVLVVRNTSGHTCVLHGAPTLTILDDSGQGSPLVSTPVKPFAKPFALHPGANGVAKVHYTPLRGCPARGSTVRVTLPGSDTVNTVAVLDTHGRPAALPLCGPAPRTGPFRPGFG
ncbi:DUF4232 domain-containing protein [Streptomyces sp. WM6378]|uniref:DUF4232 domain-containing protein n=1 Tax=Streptomyces sp. WM6378 TaxID=1415557 RepID=UPI0006C64056|nr:DUF4232 domain-containing protein [Streptomyces sp. WM6378]KOU37577.1 hypothetical protein ADK54_31655 [Streptomyces sp. WM6378]